MPSSRRMKMLTLAGVVFVVCVINYFWSSSSVSRPNYLQTLTEMHLKDSARLAAHKQLTDSLQRAAQLARDSTNKKMTPALGGGFKGRIPHKSELEIPEPEVEKVVAFGGGLNVKKEEIPARFDEEDGSMFVETEEGRQKEAEVRKNKIGHPGEEEENRRKVHEEVAGILNRSPITIFSKSYCPFAKRIKQLLLSEYRIVPAPFVFEIDQHELGPEIQKWLREFTGRKTVPNVLVNSKSIGGADDLLQLDRTNMLIPTIKELGGKQIAEIERVHEVQDGDVQ